MDKRWLKYPHIFPFLKTMYFFFNDIVEQIKIVIFMGGNVEKNISKNRYETIGSLNFYRYHKL